MKLQDIDTVFICPDHNEKFKKRKEYMMKLLDEIGIKKYSHFKASSTGDPNICLTEATIDILKNNLNDNPLLILEDDVKFTGIDSFDIPPECDAIYLGISMMGGSTHYNYCDGLSMVEHYNEKQVKVLNMLSAHAILYLTRTYKQAVIDELRKYSDRRPYWNDVIMSRIQSKYNIYANKIPCFYQSAVFNVGHESVERETKFIIPI